MYREGYRLGRGELRSYAAGMEKEWLVSNGIGGFAGMSVLGAQTRLQSAYLIASLCPPVERRVILANIHESVRIDGYETDLATQRYLGETREGYKYLSSFELNLLPSYRYQVDDFNFKKTVGLVYGENLSFVNYDVTAGSKGAILVVTPLFNFRDYCSAAQSSELRFAAEKLSGCTGLALTPESDRRRRIVFLSTDGYIADRAMRPVSMATPNYLIEENSVYDIDVRNGFNGVDNHYTPIDVVIELKPFENRRFTLLTSVCGEKSEREAERLLKFDGEELERRYTERILGLMDRADKEDIFARRLAWAADSFIVSRESTGFKTILAGYPHFSDWGRDTMIALTGLTLSTGRFDDCREILLSFTRYLKGGLVPNMFPNNADEAPLYNTMDASLWYIYAVHSYAEYTGDYEFVREKLYASMKKIIESYIEGTAFSIKMQNDGLVAGGSDLDQITWMDVRVGELVVTPRHGKPVEINALWYNALMVMERLARHLEPENGSYAKELEKLAQRVKDSFTREFWNGEDKCLYDVVSGNSKDPSIRPNQVYAVFLPYTMLDREKEICVVNKVYEELYVTLGIRSLSNRDSRYRSEYIGKLKNRDLAYHMGTSWGYLSGAFITSYLKVNNYSSSSKAVAREMLRCFLDHMADGCLNSIAEIFDGDFPSTGRGCYAQAWSVGEILRAYCDLCEK